MAGQPVEPAAVAALFHLDHARHRGAGRDRLVSPQPGAGDRRSGAQFDRRRSRGRIDPAVSPGRRSAAAFARHGGARPGQRRVRRNPGARSAIHDHGLFPAQRWDAAFSRPRARRRLPVLRRDGNRSADGGEGIPGRAARHYRGEPAFAVSRPSRRPDQDRRFGIHDRGRAQENAGRSFGGRVVRAARLHSAAGSRRNESAQNRQHRALPRLREVPRRHRCGAADRNPRAANPAARSRIRHGREAETRSRDGAGKSLPLPESGWFRLAPARRGRRGQRDPGASPAEDQDGRDLALSRNVVGGNCARLSAANRRDGTLRRGVRRASRRRHAAYLSAHPDVVPAARHSDHDRLGADRRRHSHRLFDLHSFLRCRRSCDFAGSRRCAFFAPGSILRCRNAIPFFGWSMP